MAEDRSLTVKLAAQVDGFARDLSTAMGSWDGFLKNIMGGKNTFLITGGAIAGVAAAAFGLAKTAANAGEELYELSQKTGISVEELSALKFAAEQSETNIHSLANGLKFLGNNMVEATDKNSKAALAFRALQVETKNTDGSLRSTKDVLMDVADRFTEMEDPALKSKLAMELFGKAGVDLIPFLKNGSIGIEELIEKAKELGLIISTETAVASDAFNDSLDALVKTLKSLAIQAGTPLLEPFTKVFDFIAIVGIPFVKGLVIILDGLIAGVYSTAAGFTSLWYASAKLTDSLGITDGAAQTAYDTMMKFSDESDKWKSHAENTFKAIFTGTDKSNEALKDLGKTKEKHTKITDKQVQAELESADAKKEEEKNAKALDKVFKDLDKQLKKNIMSAEDMGEQYDRNGADADAYKKAIDALIDQGLDPASDRIRNLRDKLKEVEDLKVKKAIEELNWEISVSKNVAEESAEAIAELNRIISDIWNSADPAEKAMYELNKELEIAQKLSFALGGEFDLTGAKTDLIRGKIEELVKLGVDPASEQIQVLKGQLQALRIDGAFHVQEFSDFAVDEFIKIKDAIETNLSNALADAIMGKKMDWDTLWQTTLKLVLADMIKQLIAVGIAATGVQTAIAGIFGVQAGAAGAGAAVGAGAGGVAAGAGAGAAAGGAAAGAGAGAWFMAGLAALIGYEELAASGKTTFGESVSEITPWNDQTIEGKIGNILTAILVAPLAAVDSVIKEMGQSLGDRTENIFNPSKWHLAHGGVVTEPTLSMIGEAGPEAVIPLARLSTALGGGNGHTFNFSFPNISSLENLTVGQAERLLKNAFSMAAENLNRRGYRWPMQTREV